LVPGPERQSGLACGVSRMLVGLNVAHPDARSRPYQCPHTHTHTHTQDIRYLTPHIKQIERELNDAEYYNQMTSVPKELLGRNRVL
jgi:hypothetical protein